MLGYSKDELEKIKHLISEGANQEAINALRPIVAGNNELEDTVVMLKTRLTTLQKSVREGTIDSEDANVERNKINRALLDILNILEDLQEHQNNTLTAVHSKKDETPIGTSTHPVTEKHDKSKKLFIPTQWLTRGALALVTILITVLIERSINSWFDGSSATVKDLTVRLVLQPEYPGIRLTGVAKVLIGKCAAAQQPMSSNGTYHFTGIPAECSGDTVKIELPDFKYQYKVSGQSALNIKKSNDITFNIELITNTYRGKVLYPNFEPAPGVIVEIENEPARDTTEKDGSYAITLPISQTKNIWVVIRREGKPVQRQEVGLDAAAMKVLKIPY